MSDTSPSSLGDVITVAHVQSALRCGGGAYGDVYSLNHPTLGKIAMKKLKESGSSVEIANQRRRAQREAELWKRLRHPHVLRCLGTFVQSESFYIVSPFAANGSLREFITSQPGTDRLQLLAEVISGVAYLHEAGIVHGDIKAANVLVSFDVHALLCDFGLAKDDSDVTSTVVKGAGSCPWMSPEVLKGESRTFSSDTWAVGMLIYEVLSGLTPFHSKKNHMAITFAVVFEHRLPPKEPESGPNGESYVIAWELATLCWQEIPNDRITMSLAKQKLPVAQRSDVDLSVVITSEQISRAVAIGQGGFAEVLRLTHPTLGIVALKRLRTFGSQSAISEERRRFRREGQLGSRLQHPNILRYIGFVETEEVFCLVNPYCANGTLWDYLEANPNVDRLTLLVETAAGLAYLHSHDIIHGDVKPHNVLISDDHRALLYDFGISRNVEDRTSMSMRGVVTLSFASPEAVAGEGRTLASDVWSFGLLLSAVLSGQLPFAGKNPLHILSQISEEGFQPQSRPSNSLSGASYGNAWALGEACWQKRPEYRISMQQALQCLQRNCPPADIGFITPIQWSPSDPLAKPYIPLEMQSANHLEQEPVQHARGSGAERLDVMVPISGFWRRMGARFLRLIS